MIILIIFPLLEQAKLNRKKQRNYLKAKKVQDNTKCADILLKMPYAGGFETEKTDFFKKHSFLANYQTSKMMKQISKI